MKASEYRSKTTQKVIVYGAPKSGKSAAVAQLSRHYNLLWFDGENGVDVMFNPQLKIPASALEHIEIISTVDTAKVPAFAEIVAAITKWTNFNVCNEHGKLRCIACNKAGAVPFTVDFSKLDASWIIVIDSLTQVSNSVMNMIKIARGVDPTLVTDDDSKSNFNDFGKQGTWLDNNLAAIQNCPYNIIVISHEQEVKQDDGTEKLVPVGGTRNFSRNVSRYFGHVVKMSLVNRKHKGISSSTASSTMLTGSRTGANTETFGGEEGESILRTIFTDYTNYVRTEVPYVAPVLAAGTKPAAGATTNVK